MSTFVITLLWILSLCVLWAWCAHRYHRLECTVMEYRDGLDQACDNFLRIRRRQCAKINRLIGEVRRLTRLNLKATELGRRDAHRLRRQSMEIDGLRERNGELAQECQNNYAQLERSEAGNAQLRERLTRAEQLCTANLNKSFRARLPWPTVFAQAFSEDHA